MPILIRHDSAAKSLQPHPFDNEAELERLLIESGDLLAGDRNQCRIQFVDRQVAIGDCKLDLLFVDSEGLPIMVEVKLGRNGEARRQVVAQAIDYLSSLTELTVDELNMAVGLKLESALGQLAADGDDDEKDFDYLWDHVGANLRKGIARMVVVLDQAPASLERIFRFLAEKSKLDVQLLTVQRYRTEFGDVVVPQMRVDPVTEQPGNHSRTADTPHALLAVFNAYNASAPLAAQAFGTASSYRMVRPEGPKGVHYGFLLTKSCISVRARHKEPDVKRRLKSLAGKSVGNDEGVLKWDDDGSTGWGSLQAQFPLATPAEIVAKAMRDLIRLTQDPIINALEDPRTETIEV